jgi:hypothetical protein
MNYAPFVAAALIAAGLLAANGALASSTAQQSITQSSDSDTQSSSSVVSNSSVSSRTSSGGNLQIEQDLSGRIASSQVNLTSGEVEAVLFGDWALNSTGFAADFALTPANGSGATRYNMSGLQLHSVQEVNDNLALAGTIDVASNATAIQDAPVTITVQGGVLIVGFARDTPAGDLFKGVPVIGIAR